MPSHIAAHLLWRRSPDSWSRCYIWVHIPFRWCHLTRRNTTPRIGCTHFHRQSSVYNLTKTTEYAVCIGQVVCTTWQRNIIRGVYRQSSLYILIQTTEYVLCLCCLCIIIEYNDWHLYRKVPVKLIKDKRHSALTPLLYILVNNMTNNIYLSATCVVHCNKN